MHPIKPAYLQYTELLVLQQAAVSGGQVYCVEPGTGRQVHNLLSGLKFFAHSVRHVLQFVILIHSDPLYIDIPASYESPSCSSRGIHFLALVVRLRCNAQYLRSILQGRHTEIPAIR